MRADRDHTEKIAIRFQRCSLLFCQVLFETAVWSTMEMNLIRKEHSDGGALFDHVSNHLYTNLGPKYCSISNPISQFNIREQKKTIETGLLSDSMANYEVWLTVSIPQKDRADDINRFFYCINWTLSSGEVIINIMPYIIWKRAAIYVRLKDTIYHTNFNSSVI